MKITYAKPINNTISFHDIPYGTCFIDRDGSVCVKLEYQYEDIYDIYCFTDNKLYSSGDYTAGAILDVRIVEVELIVHAEER